MSTFSRLVRFRPSSSIHREPLIGQPLDNNQDVGLAMRDGDPVAVSVFSGQSVLTPGHPTGSIETIGELLSPLARHEVGTIRCIGLNVSWKYTGLEIRLTHSTPAMQRR